MLMTGAVKARQAPATQISKGAIMTAAPANCTLNFPRLTANERAVIGAGAALKGLTAEEYIRTCMGYGYPAKSPEAP